MDVSADRPLEPVGDRPVKLSAIDVGEGPAVVLLHGQPGSGGDWAPVTRRLRERMRVVAPDRPGYGRSGGRAVGFAANAAALVGLLDRLEIESAVVVGHSWASGVVLAAALHHPQQVRALVLAAPVAPGIPLAIGDRLLASRVAGPPLTWLSFALLGLGLALPPLRRLAHASMPALPPEQVAAAVAGWRAPAVRRSFFIEQRALVSELPLLAPELGKVDAPATILYGTRDRIAPPRHARSLAAALPQARLVPVERAGHMLPQQRPGLVARTIAAAAAGVVA